MAQVVESVFLALLLEAAIVVIIALAFRATGTRLPEWIGPKWLVKRVNDWIDGDPKRLERLMEFARIAR